MKNRMVIAFALVAASALLSLYCRELLPARVPVHFNAAGVANGWAPKNQALVIFPAVTLFLAFIYWAAITINRNPNYWTRKLKKPVSDENLKLLIRSSQKVLDFVFIVILSMFLYLHGAIMRIALGSMKSIVPGIWIFLGILIAGMIFLIIRTTILQYRVLK
jgi:hypothetical protein